MAYYLGFYAAWVVLGLVTVGASTILYYVGAIKASRIIHRRLVDRIFGGELHRTSTCSLYSVHAILGLDTRGKDHQSFHKGEQSWTKR